MYVTDITFYQGICPVCNFEMSDARGGGNIYLPLSVATVSDVYTNNNN